MFVLEGMDHLSPIPSIGHEVEDIGEGGALCFKERVEGIPEDMLHAHAPGIGPELFPGFHEAGCGKRDFVVSDAAEGVVSVWLIGRWSVEVYEVSFSLIRNGVCDSGR